MDKLIKQHLLKHKMSYEIKLIFAMFNIEYIFHILHETISHLKKKLFILITLKKKKMDTS